MTDDDVGGERIDVKAAGALIERSGLVVAHNARFDRPFVERVQRGVGRERVRFTFARTRRAGGSRSAFSAVWGRAASAAERLWSAPDARAFERGEDFEAEGRLEAELGYGLSVPGTVGVVTPYTGLSLIEKGSRTVRAGARWQMSPEARLGLEGARAQRDGETAHDVMLQLRVEF